MQSFYKTIKFSRNRGFKSPNPLQKGVKHLVLISFRNNFGGYHTDHQYANVLVRFRLRDCLARKTPKFQIEQDQNHNLHLINL